MIESMRQQVDALLAEQQVSQRRVEDEQRELAVAGRDHEATREAQVIIQRLAHEVQSQAHRRITDVVSQCLEAVFQDPYELEIVWERKRGRTEARLVFRRQGVEVDPLSGAGGGVCDVASFALRLACLILHRPPLRRLLVLDEPFKHVDARAREALRLLLEQLSEDLGIQIVMITHATDLEAGKIVQIPGDSSR